MTGGIEFSTLQLNKAKAKGMKFWYPLRSREVAEIVSHLTSEEKSQLESLARENGSWIGKRVGPIAVISVIMGDHLIHSFPLGFLLELSVSLLIFFILFGSRIRVQRRKWKEFLCSSVYGRQSGYRVDSLRTSLLW